MKSTEIILAFATLVAIASCTQSTTPTCIVEGNLVRSMPNVYGITRQNL